MSSCPVSLVSFVHESSELACKFSSSDQYKSYSDLKQTKKTHFLKNMVRIFMNLALINLCSARDYATE